jgi:RsiW-degrading membrane proteinase PrsW (M82 family)
MLSDLLQGLRITFYLQLSYKLKKGKIKKNKFKGPRTSFYIATVLLHLLLRTYITSNISECFLTYMFVYILPVLGDVGKGLNPLLLLSA